MRTHGKKFGVALAKVDRAREFPVGEAVKLVKQASFAKFNETVDVAVRLGVDPAMRTRWSAARWCCRTARASRSGCS